MDRIEDLFFTETGDLNILAKALTVVVIIVAAGILIRIFENLIFKRLKVPGRLEESKVDTMKSVIFNVVKAIVIFVASMTVLETLGVNTSSLIATAGIGGVALGFGAQYIVKDYISGAVIISEDQYRVGELVIIEGFEGYVEEVGLRLTKLRDFDGKLHILQNGSIRAVTNQSRGPQRVRTDIYVKKDINSIKVFEAIDRALERINNSKAFKDKIDQKFVSLGITNMTDFDAVYTLKGMVEPEYQWKIDAYVRKVAMDELSKAGLVGDKGFYAKGNFEGRDAQIAKEAVDEANKESNNQKKEN